MDRSIVVQLSKVQEVLLADGWHMVNDGTFGIGELAFVDDKNTGLGPGARIAAVEWIDRERGKMACQLSAVLAIRSN